MSDHAKLLRQVRQALQKDDFSTALSALTSLIQDAREAEDHAALARHHGSIALVHHRLGQLDAALEHFVLALESARVIGDPAMESGLLGNAGKILRELRRFDDAIAYLENALALAVDAGDERGRGLWFSHLALVYDDMSEFGYSIPLHQQSIVVARSLRDLRGLAARLGYIAHSYIRHGDAPSALVHLQEAVMLDRDLDDKPSLAGRLATIGNLYVGLAQRTNTRSGMQYCFVRALDHLRQSLNLAHETGDVLMQADILRVMGDIFYQSGDYDQAINHLDTAYQMFSGLGYEAPLIDLERAVAQAQAARQLQATGS
ncbi:MAG: tetratricopeptide repeat protein [Anaerolineae bacterium]|nr:tetratricopeptide repeat protein [Anaerolineae bacterium]